MDLDPGITFVQARELARPRVYQLPASTDLPARWHWACPCGHVNTWPFSTAERANTEANTHAKHCDTARFRALRSALENEASLLTAAMWVSRNTGAARAYEWAGSNLRSVLAGFAA